MLSLVLAAAAAALYYGLDAAKLQKAVEWIRARADLKKLVAVAMLAAAALLLLPAGPGDDTPTPAPDGGPLVLAGAFVGETAAEDACVVGCLCGELAAELEYDGAQPEASRYLTTGQAVDELRRIARVLRCKGHSIGDRQPIARDKIAAHLEATVGTDGGPLTADQRSRWITALRDIERAAHDAIN